jgi:predicted regulator of Ras-like GTPase activity (Roadblock/LC7/MglB family)
MVPVVKEWRHVLLMTAILAALPLLVYPNSIGLNIRLGMVWYFILEMIYFYTMFRLLNPRGDNRTAMLAAPMSFIGRLLMSTAFFVLLLILGSVKLGSALAGAFGSYKPALLLFSLTAPVVYNGTIKLLVAEFQPKPRRARPAQREVIITGSGEEPAQKRKPETPAVNEHFDFSFDAAVRHVGQYSGVSTALLVDQEGLLVAQYSRNHEDVEMWAALTLEIVGQFTATMAAAGAGEMKWMDFCVGERRFNMMRIEDLWLLSIAVAATDELEKIRMQQAAEMISKRYNERYSNLHISEMEKEYAGSTVGA